jgi:chromosomal replication initiator protein
VTSQLNANYTFDQFVVGNTNRVAHAAAQAVTDNPGKNYNPFFLYGGTGVGKTHLVQAIGNALIAKNPSTRVLYCSIERFMNDFIYSIRFKTTNEFKAKYRSCDVLIVDDIQFIAGDKQSTQEEFFHTYNELHASGKQIILCSDRPPREIGSLTDRLVSRFEGGLSVDIAQPDFETRAAIIQAKAERLNIELTPDITEYLADQGAENIRSLEGMMLKLQTVVLADRQPLTLVKVQSFLGPAAASSINQPLNPNVLLKLVCETYGVTLKELSGKTRTQNLVTPRHLAMYLLRQDLGLNLETIGQLLGGRDHTTIMHGIEKVAKTVTTNDQLRASLQSIRQAAAK